MDKARNYDENRLVTGIKLANARIFEQASTDAEVQGHGHDDRLACTSPTTRRTSATWATAACTSSARACCKQLTEDHSLLNDYLKAKKLTPEEIENFPHKNVIVRALGMKETVQVDVARVEPQEGDIFLLCSDGLSGMVTDPQMQELLDAHAGAGEGVLAAHRHGERGGRQRQRHLRAGALPRQLRLTG